MHITLSRKRITPLKCRGGGATRRETEGKYFRRNRGPNAKQEKVISYYTHLKKNP